MTTNKVIFYDFLEDWNHLRGIQVLPYLILGLCHTQGVCSYMIAICLFLSLGPALGLPIEIGGSKLSWVRSETDSENDPLS